MSQRLHCEVRETSFPIGVKNVGKAMALFKVILEGP